MHTRGYFKLKSATSVVAVVLLSVSAAHAQQTVVFNPTLDTTIYSDNFNFSSGQGGWGFFGTTANGALRRSLIEFDLSSISPDSVVTGAALTIEVDRAVGDTVPVGLHRVLAPWGEGGSDAGSSGSGTQAQPGDTTWVSRGYPDSTQNWATAGGDFIAAASATTAVGAPGTSTWSATPALIADLQAWVTNGSTNHGWMIVGTEGGDRSAKRFFTGEGLPVELRPNLTLQVSPVPEPTILVSLLAGLGMFAGMRRRLLNRG